MARPERPLVIITAIGSRDRPGIIAALTEAVLRFGGNLDDATMTRLHGAFATMIAARVGASDLPALGRALDTLGIDLSLSVSVATIEEADPVAMAPPDHVVSVYGADHPGIVHHVSALFQRHGANITDLETHLTAANSDRPLYVMLLETAGGDWDRLPTALAELGRDQSVDISFSILEEETL